MQRSQFPGLGHHDAEVFISVDGSRNIFVVVTEFVKSDVAVSDLSVPHAHELAVGLLRSLLASHDIWVLTDVVDARDIIESHGTISIDVELVVGLADEANTAIAQFASQCADELVEVDGAGVVPIEVADENCTLLLRQVDIKVLKTPHKLVDVELPVSIIVQDAEDTADAANRHGSS